MNRHFFVLYLLSLTTQEIIMNEKDFLTVKELCEWIRLSRSKVYALVTANKIPHAKVGGKILFNKEKIKIWIENQSK
jgi:putative molybdopterin biosynthesis protein